MAAGTTPPPGPGVPAASASDGAVTSLDALAWLRGCWKGAVNRREFREQWSPPRGDMMVGISHTVVGWKTQAAAKQKTDSVGEAPDAASAKTQDFEYLRLESRADGIYYVVVPSGKKELSFKLTDVADDRGAKLFTFANTVDEFPQRIVYRRASEGWLYAQLMAKPGTRMSDVTYPMRHVDCLSDAPLED
ncbi:MAG TPA: DUF6265 family protein [Casimicrobiaceae bacterium]